MNSTPKENETLQIIQKMCAITHDYKLHFERKQHLVMYDLGAEFLQIPYHRTPQLQKLIKDLQASFMKEANVLLNNQMSDHDIKELFANYQRFLLTCYQARRNYYDESYEPKFLISPNKTDRSMENIINDLVPDSDAFLYDFSSDMLINQANAITNMSTTCLPLIDPLIDTADQSLLNINEFLYPENALTPEQTPPKIQVSDYTSYKNSLGFSYNGQYESNNFFGMKKNQTISEARAFLELVFEVKQAPNSVERRMIAEKCGLTPVQVRVWFSNKRSRQKGK